MRPLVLASSSPRRQELLKASGLPFTVIATAVPEAAEPGEKARAMVVRLSQAKARVAAASAPPEAVIIAADTTVVLFDAMRETILEKPVDTADAERMLRLLRGRKHSVFTAVTLLDTRAPETEGAGPREETDVFMAWVPMRNYSDEEIAAYVASGDPLDKAGAYAIQYPDFQPVDLPRFTDCYLNVMGLPVCAVLKRLHEWTVTAAPGAPRPQVGDCRHAAHRAAPPACPILDRLAVPPR